MASVRESLGVSTRRAVARILGSADSLPERSKASRVLTAVACRFQLFVFELERARHEHFGLGVEGLLSRLQQHCQLLVVAGNQGGGVQSGYALLSELSELLQDLEAAVLLLPGQLGSEARYKPALDELQALLANVSQYRSECDDTRSHLEAALSDLVHSDAGGATVGPATSSADVAAATVSAIPPSIVQAGSASGFLAAPAPATAVDGGAAAASTDAAVLHRVRQVICALDLDVDMTECGQDLDAELLLLRRRMQQELGRQEHDSQHSDSQGPAVARQGARRWRDGPGGPSDPGSPKSQSAEGLVSASGAAADMIRLSAVHGGGSGRASRLHEARHVSRRLAAQHLAHLKEQQRQMLQRTRDEQPAGDGGGADVSDVDEQPAARRRRMQAVEAVDASDLPAAPSGSAQDDVMAPSGSSTLASGSGHALGSSSSGDAGSEVLLAGAEADGSGAGRAPSADTMPGGQELLALAGPGVHVGGGDGGRQSGGGGPAAVVNMSTVASVAAVRRLNLVTTLAGMWEAGRPVAQQPGHDGGGESDSEGGHMEDRGSDCGDGAGGDGVEMPCRPAEQAAAPGVRRSQQQQSLPELPQCGRAAANSPFTFLALQGRAPKAPPPPVLIRPVSPPEPLLEDMPAWPAGARAAPPDGRGGGRESGGGSSCSPVSSPTAAAAAAAQRPRGAPAPLPLPDASVHLRAVGMAGCFAPHWAPPGPFGPPGHGLWLGDCALTEGEQLLDFGPDVPTLDLHRDITGWGACLGRGAFGAVYKALFRNKPAAVKVLHGGALDARDMLSLRTEISLLCRLRHHPNIITVYGAAAAPPDHVALVTELMDCDLYDYIHRRRQNCVPLEEVLVIARAIAAGLSELHPAIVHRDLKPANVLLRHSAPQPQAVGGQPLPMDRRLTVKIADFGLARHKRSQYLSTRERDAGTLKYMAPECVATGGGRRDGAEGGEEGGSGITEKCDIYSFGVLLYELITGREPWEGCHPLYAMCQVQSGVTLPLPDDPDRCPPALRSLVERCWCYQHHQRPSSRELLAALDGVIADWRRRLSEGGAQTAAEAPTPWQ